ncbi:MAG: S-ribosylhomocysteine lyase [Actinomycetaceae bacterium]|nr:S-ribosylhomocysteine lyase [Actinomycetaceae bacterium]
MPQMNVESFNLDHRLVKAPYVRVADIKRLPAGDVITKYDVRFTQPNIEHLDMPAIHSIEHSFAEYSRNRADNIVDFSPMGCQTGFYLIRVGEPDIEGTIELIAQTFEDILAATDVPAANEIQCGWGANHSLDGAKKAVRAMLDQRDTWTEVGV